MAERALAPLEKLDPAQAWTAWQPDNRDRWTLTWAGHLFRRAAFGGTLDELRQAVRRALPATLDRLLTGDRGAGERLQFLTTTGELIARQGDPVSLRGWWLYCMLHSLYPLREKLTLFWHDHFATSVNKVG